MGILMDWSFPELFPWLASVEEDGEVIELVVEVAGVDCHVLVVLFWLADVDGDATDLIAQSL